MKLSATASAEKVEPSKLPPARDACPRCGKTLIDPAGLGWCSGCGFCKSLADDESKKLLADRKSASLGGVVEASNALAGLPLWFWASFLFIGVGIAFTIFMDQRLPTGDNLERATWATLLLASGAFMIFLAQVCALVAIAPEEPTMSFKDAIVPGKVWGGVFRRLPRCRECVWFALLGLSLMIGSVAFIGGLQHWFTYLPKSLAQQEKDKAKARSGGGEAVVLPID